MHRARFAVALAILVVLAGCASAGDGGSPTTDATTGGDQSSTTPTVTPSPSDSSESADSDGANDGPATSPDTTTPSDPFPVPPNAVEAPSPDPGPRLGPDTQIRVYELPDDPPTVTAWYREDLSDWTERRAVESYDPRWGWLNEVVLTRGETNLFVYVSSIEDGSRVTLARGTGVVGVGNSYYYPELGHGSVTYTVSPLDPSTIASVTPLGNLNPPGHTFPTDHSYLLVRPDDRPYDVVAPADGVITEVEYRRLGEPAVDDYAVFITHTNTFETQLSHMASVDPAIREALGGLEPGRNAAWIPVEAGDRLGTAPSPRSAALDWWVTDYDRTLTGFAHPEYYGDSVHAVSFLDYSAPSLRDELLAKQSRTAEPLGGRIDYDEPGRLVGNWFVATEPFAVGEWSRHLAFVYAVDDPGRVRVAIGGTIHPAGYYAVAGNGPDPASVSADTGPVVYHLQPIEPGGWENETVEATLLVEVVDDGLIRVEAFEGERANPSFTDDAVPYVR